MFLEAEGQLGCSPAWTQLQPLSGSVLEGVARLPKQVSGSFPDCFWGHAVVPAARCFVLRGACGCLWLPHRHARRHVHTCACSHTKTLQVLGHGRSIPNPVEAAQSTSRTGDLLRRLKEFGTSMKGDFKASAALPQDEAGLRVSQGHVLRAVLCRNLC